MPVDNSAATRTTQTDGTNSAQKVAQPWGPAIPGLSDAMSASGNIFNNSGLAYAGWPGPSQVPMDYRTAGSLDSMWDLASAGNSLGNSAYTNANNIISRGGYSDDLRAALTGLQGMAPQYQQLFNNANNSPAGITAFADRITGGLGMDPYYQAAMGAIMQPTSSASNLGGIASGAQGLKMDPHYNSALSDVIGRTSAAENYLTQMADGSEATNPFLQEMLKANATNTANLINSQFAGSGRLASGQHQGVMGQKITEATAPILASAYESAKARQLSATGQIDAATQAQFAQRLQTLTGMSAARATDIANQIAASGQIDSATAQRLGLGLNAIQGMGNFRQNDMSNLLSATGQYDAATSRNYANQLAALNGQQSMMTNAAQMHAGAIDRTGQFGDRAGSLYANLYQPYQYGMQVGNAYQQEQQNQLNDAMRYWSAAQGFPQQSTSQYSALMAQLAGLGGITNTDGTTSETKVGPDTSPQQWQQLLGLGLTGLGTAGKLGLFGGLR
jgi:hypothetical protein